MGFLLQRGGDWSRLGKNHLGLRRDQLFGNRLHISGSRRNAIIDMNIAALEPSMFFEFLLEGLHVWIVGDDEHANAAHALRLLGQRCGRPRHRAAD